MQMPSARLVPWQAGHRRGGLSAALHSLCIISSRWLCTGWKERWRCGQNVLNEVWLRAVLWFMRVLMSGFVFEEGRGSGYLQASKRFVSS